MPAKFLSKPAWLCCAESQERLRLQVLWKIYIQCIGIDFQVWFSRAEHGAECHQKDHAHLDWGIMSIFFLTWGEELKFFPMSTGSLQWEETGWE